MVIAGMHMCAYLSFSDVLENLSTVDLNIGSLYLSKSEALFKSVALFLWHTASKQPFCYVPEADIQEVKLNKIIH